MKIYLKSEFEIIILNNQRFYIFDLVMIPNCHPTNSKLEMLEINIGQLFTYTSICPILIPFLQLDSMKNENIENEYIVNKQYICKFFYDIGFYLKYS